MMIDEDHDDDEEEDEDREDDDEQEGCNDDDEIGVPLICLKLPTVVLAVHVMEGLLDEAVEPCYC